MIEINRNPSAGQVRQFAVGWLVFLGLVGLIVLRRTGSLHAAGAVWALAAVGAALGLIAPRLMRPVYVGSSYAAFPIGWLVSHLVLAAVYYFVLTPIGLVMRLFGRDPLRRTFDRAAESYWTPHNPGERPERYFRRF